MRVALTGASGFLGSAFARELSAAGHLVTGLVRPSSRRDHIEAVVDRFVVGDQADPTCWPDLLDGAECVIHNSLDWSSMRPEPPDLGAHLATNLAGSLLLLRDSAPRQFVFVSSMAVYHEILPRPVGPHGLALVDEDHPLRPRNEYGAYKAAIESHLWAAHLGDGRHTCAIRPCAVYGIDPRLERSHGFQVVQELRRSGAYSKPGGLNFVHIDDVARALVATVGNPAAAGRVYNLVDCHALHADWAAMAAEVLGIQPDIAVNEADRPAHAFSKAAAATLGVRLDRGHAGILAHLRELISVLDQASP
ncbi:MAG: NAD(P)-dependent oxidoreductase [Phycisphaerales bacterium]|nr:NAD(P)-dependent oxidoreductase [Phycisphaerales bacterium]